MVQCTMTVLYHQCRSTGPARMRDGRQVPEGGELIAFDLVTAGHIHDVSHSGLLEPRGTSTVRKEPGVRDMTIWSVIPW
jgi:hypothetical protein